MSISRAVTRLNVVVAATGGVSPAFNMRPYSGGIVHMPAAWTAAALAFLVSGEEEGTYELLYQADGTICRIENDDSVAVQGLAYPLPAELFGAHWVKLFSNNPASAAAVDQAAARTVWLDLKA